MKYILLSLLMSVVFFQTIADTQVHVVQRGETLESIAYKYGVSVQQIKDLNPKMGKFFYAGLKLNIPEKIAEEDVLKRKSTNREIHNVNHKQSVSKHSNYSKKDSVKNDTEKKESEGVIQKISSTHNLDNNNIDFQGDSVIFSPRSDLSASQIQQMVKEANPYTLYKLGRSVEYLIYDSEGYPITSFTETVSNVDVRNGLQIVTVKQFVSNKLHKEDITFNRRSVETFFVTEIDVNGIYHLTHDLQRDNWWKVKKRDGYAVLFPSKVAVGQQIKGGEIQDAITAPFGTRVSPHATYSNVRVEGFESLQTPAGTFDCVKIIGEVVQTDFFVISQSISYQFCWWFAKGIGLVRCDRRNLVEKPVGQVVTPPAFICINKILND